MIVTIRMTHEEVMAACAAWFHERQVSVGPEQLLVVLDLQSDRNQTRVNVVVNGEAGVVTGPYR